MTGEQLLHLRPGLIKLRTPLAVVSLQLDMLDRVTEIAERKTANLKLRSSVDQCIRLVQNLLLLAQQEASEVLTKEMHKVSLSAIVQDVLEEYAPLARDKNIILVFLKTDKNIIVLAEPYALRIMIGNIVCNAIVYTPKGGKVEIEIEDDAGGVSLSIADNGGGIPEKDRTRIFDRFYRVPGTQESGSGLGLSIVKNIASQQNIKVIVGDGLNGRGTTFKFLFPALRL